MAVNLTDHIGSVDVVVRFDWDPATGTWKADAGQVAGEKQSYNAWGERRNGNDGSELRGSVTVAQRTSAVDENRGFTGHEMLDDFGLIHMNGRIYDPELGRFLSADPFVQVPEKHRRLVGVLDRSEATCPEGVESPAGRFHQFSQNFNRYSYVLNNPLSMTDPSGNLIKGLIHGYAFLKAREATRDFLASNPQVAQIVGIIVAIVLFFVIGPGSAGVVNGLSATLGVSQATAQVVAAGYTGAISGSFNAAAAGGDAEDVLRGAAVGAASGAITTGVLHPLGATTSADAFSGSVIGDRALNIAGHGVVGGASSAAMGGKFQDGFLSGAVSAAGAVAGLYDTPLKGNAGVVARTVMAGIVGGTASAVGGGKFANGAYTAAFQHLFGESSAAAQRPISSGRWPITSLRFGLNVIANDLIAGAFGIVSKPLVLGLDFYYLGRSLFTSRADFLPSLGQVVQQLAIPTYGFYGGARVGTEGLFGGFGLDQTPRPLNWVDWASFWHDSSLQLGSYDKPGYADQQWTRDVLRPHPGSVPPGPIGLGYAAIGIPSFTLFSWFRGATLGAPPTGPVADRVYRIE
jgi:RHS repeat-associated protein